MKKAFFYNILLFCILMAGFSLGYFFPKKFQPRSSSVKINIEKGKKNFTATQEKPIAVVIPAYNIAPWYEKMLHSVFEQKYTNFRLIFIDDHSDDGTYEKVKCFIDTYYPQHNVTILQNPQKVGSALNYYKAIQRCQDHEIIVCLEGDDWLAHPKVLSKINDIYADPNVWITYSDYVEYPSYHLGYTESLCEEVIKRNGYRGHKWVFSQLKTFYAGLYKKIRIQDFFYGGRFSRICWDWPAMFAMLEMAHGHIEYIPEVLVIHNIDNPLSSNKIELGFYLELSSRARGLSGYKPLSQAPYKPSNYKDLGTDIIIFSLDRCMQLHACLESIQKHMVGVNNIFVIYYGNNEKYDKGYEKLKSYFPHVHFILQPKPLHKTFQQTFLHYVFDEKVSPSKYVMFGVDASLVKDKTNVYDIVEIMEKTQAYVFFLSLGYGNTANEKKPPMAQIYDDVYCWQLPYGEGVWNWPHNLDMTVYNKETIRKVLQELNYVHPNELRKFWALKDTPASKDLALCFENSKIIHMSGYQNQNFITPQQFQEKYLKGYKIDISPFFQLHNSYYYVEHEVQFIKR